jgi:putative MATE family efflux protein
MMRFKREPVRTTSITEGSIAKGLLLFFFPILFGSFFQQMYNVADAIIVGRFIGKEALAAVGGGTSVFVNLLVGFFVGITNGASVVISQHFGANEKDKTHLSIQTSMVMSFIGGVIVMALGLSTSKWAMRLIATPDDILDMSVTYLDIFFLGMIPMFLYNMSASALRSMGDSKRPLYILILGCLVNILLDVLFVAVFRWGVAGAAWATVGCETISAMLGIYFLRHNGDKSNCFSFHGMGINGPICRKMLYLGIPAGIQGSMYSISNIIIQGSINSLGTNIIAANAAYGKVDTLFWMCINSFGVAMTVFSGQNYGASQFQRVRKGTWVCLGMSSLMSVLFSVIFLTWGRSFLSLFTTDATVLDDGVTILRCVAPFFITWVSIEILSGTIRGCGQSVVPTLLTVFGVCVLRIFWVAFYFPDHHTIQTVMYIYPISWSVTSVLFWIYYATGHWMAREPRKKRDLVA